jgi:SET family sugar efflux transporter-like MFS transporter
MSLGPLARLAATPAYRYLVTACLLVGFRDAMAEPYIVLFAADKAHLGPLALGAFLTARAAGAIAISMGFGLWLDRAPSMLPLTFALLMGVAGYLLCATTTDFLFLLPIAAVPLAANGAAFPQLFALAKAHLDRSGRESTEGGIAVMRASFSAAWAIGPVVGALLVERSGFGGVFLVSALCGLAAYGVVAWSGLRAAAPHPLVQVGGAGRRTPFRIGLSAAAFTMFFMAMIMGSVALPLVVTRDLHGVPGDIGVAAGVCALLEVPVMIAVALRSSLLGGYGGLAAGFVAMTIYFVAVACASTVELVVLSQALRAVGIGLVTCVGINYVQHLMPNRVGAAAALFTITSQIGSLLAGLAAGAWAEVFGYHSLFLVCALACGAGLLLLSLGARPAQMRTAPA